MVAGDELLCVACGRLLWSTGVNTILATYMVGIYCNRQLIGQGIRTIRHHVNEINAFVSILSESITAACIELR